MKKIPSLNSIVGKVDRAKIVSDITNLVSVKVREKNGIAGIATRKVYFSAQKMHPGIDKKAVNLLLDDIILSLDPYYAAFLNSKNKESSLKNYFDIHKMDIGKSILDCVETRAENIQKRKLLDCTKYCAQ